MNLTVKNPNYCASVVELTTLRPLEKCDNVQGAIIFGNQVIVDKRAKIGDIGLFFPVETALSPVFLKNNNLYRDPELNLDKNAKGYFEPTGRVKCVKFRGHRSEGFFIPLESLGFLYGGPVVKGPDVILQVIQKSFPLGSDFDHVDDILICEKYIPRNQRALATGPRPKKARQARPEDKIIPHQFRLHFDTSNLRKNVHKINPEDFISITDKWHGTSVVIGNLLIKRDLKWYEKILQKLGVNIEDKKYGIVWSSRCVIKGVDGQEKTTNRNFYREDIWGVVAHEIKDKIPPGYTIYGEIVGHTPGGSEIQKGYAYGCAPGTHKLVIYRVTHTNVDGSVIELTFPQMEQFCLDRGLETVKNLFYGPAKNLLPWKEHWHEDFLLYLENLYISGGKGKDRECPYNPGMPAEGIVVRVDKYLNQCESFKLKSFDFLQHETKQLDKGVLDIETNETQDETNTVL